MAETTKVVAKMRDRAGKGGARSSRREPESDAAYGGRVSRNWSLSKKGPSPNGLGSSYGGCHGYH